MPNKKLYCLKKSKYVKFKNYEKKTKSPFKTYADFEGILVPEENWKQNPKDSYTNSYYYKLVYADDKFSKPFKTCLSKVAI